MTEDLIKPLNYFLLMAILGVHSCDMFQYGEVVDAWKEGKFIYVKVHFKCAICQKSHDDIYIKEFKEKKDDI